MADAEIDVRTRGTKKARDELRRTQQQVAGLGRAARKLGLPLLGAGLLTGFLGGSLLTLAANTGTGSAAIVRMQGVFDDLIDSMLRPLEPAIYGFLDWLDRHPLATRIIAISTAVAAVSIALLTLATRAVGAWRALRALSLWSALSAAAQWVGAAASGAWSVALGALTLGARAASIALLPFAAVAAVLGVPIWVVVAGVIALAAGGYLLYRQYGSLPALLNDIGESVWGLSLLLLGMGSVLLTGRDDAGFFARGMELLTPRLEAIGRGVERLRARFRGLMAGIANPVIDGVNRAIAAVNGFVRSLWTMRFVPYIEQTGSVGVSVAGFGRIAVPTFSGGLRAPGGSAPQLPSVPRVAEAGSNPGDRAWRGGHTAPIVINVSALDGEDAKRALLRLADDPQFRGRLLGGTGGFSL